MGQSAGDRVLVSIKITYTFVKTPGGGGFGGDLEGKVTDELLYYESGNLDEKEIGELLNRLGSCIVNSDYSNSRNNLSLKLKEWSVNDVLTFVGDSGWLGIFQKD